MRISFRTLCASLLLTALSGLAQAPQPSLSAKGFYYALVIGINRYPHQPVLKTAVNDAVAVEAILRERYGFRTRLLLDADATRSNILDAFGEYRRSLREADELLIYYAGHGIRDGEKAYWLPVDSRPESTADWIISDDITTSIRVIPARQVLIVSDSCYSGGLSRGVAVAGPASGPNATIAKLLEQRSRILISSGGDEPVADGGTGGHSVFTAAFLDGLQTETEPAFSAESLFVDYVRDAVIGRSEQIPTHAIIQNSGHERGDFVFFQAAASAAATPALRPAPIAEVPPSTDPSPARAATPPDGANPSPLTIERIVPLVLPAPPTGYSSSVAKPAVPTAIRLQEVSHKPNQITDGDKWFLDNQLSLPTFQVPRPVPKPGTTSPVPASIPVAYSGDILVDLIRSGDFLLGLYGHDYADGRYLAAFSATTMQPAWILDFDKYLMPPAFIESDRNYVSERVNWAWIEAGVLYVSNFHDTYAKSSRGLNGYLNAFDLASKRLLWRTKPLTINSSEFAIVKDAIIAGYGFTAETHFLYVLDKRDGSIVQTIPVVKSPEHIIVKDGLVYVRTYDTDYVFKILHQ